MKTYLAFAAALAVVAAACLCAGRRPRRRQLWRCRTATARAAAGGSGAQNAIAEALAAEFGAAFADWRAVVIDPAETSVDVHPLQKDSTQVVEHLVRALDQAAPECTK